MAFSFPRDKGACGALSDQAVDILAQGRKAVSLVGFTKMTWELLDGRGPKNERSKADHNKTNTQYEKTKAKAAQAWSYLTYQTAGRWDSRLFNVGVTRASGNFLQKNSSTFVRAHSGGILKFVFLVLGLKIAYFGKVLRLLLLLRFLGTTMLFFEKFKVRAFRKVYGLWGYFQPLKSYITLKFRWGTVSHLWTGVSHAYWIIPKIGRIIAGVTDGADIVGLALVLVSRDVKFVVFSSENRIDEL